MVRRFEVLKKENLIKRTTPRKIFKVQYEFLWKEKVSSNNFKTIEWLANLTRDLKVVGSNLVSSYILDGNKVKAMPGLIPAPNSDSI
jgi:hypothetical protein